MPEQLTAGQVLADLRLPSPQIAKMIEELVREEGGQDMLEHLRRDKDLYLRVTELTQTLVASMTLAYVLAPDADFEAIFVDANFSAGDTLLASIGNTMVDWMATVRRDGHPEITPTILINRISVIRKALY